MTLDPDGTLLRIAWVTLGLGTAWGLLAGAAIYLGSTLLPPRVPQGRVWRDWRRKRVLWALCLLIAAAGAWLSAEAIAARLAARDMYWWNRLPDAVRIGLLGAGSGYLLALLLLTIAPLLCRRKGVRGP